MLEITNLWRSYGSRTILRGISLTIETGEIIGLVGASGSGKTTLLRIIAGLDKPDQGSIYLNGEPLLPVPVHQRDFGMVFQDFALFPHLNVAQNIAFGLKLRGVAPAQQQARVDEVLALVGLSGFGERDVAALSGGEKQRVAVARSLAPEPRLLLLDEPLGSLDAGLRERLALDLREIIKQTGLTAIHVTHDLQEAFAIADRIAVLSVGDIAQIDTPPRLVARPRTPAVARLLGLTNILPIIRREGDQVITAVSTFTLTDADATAVLLHPDGITPAAQGDITGIIRERVFLGDRCRVTLEHRSGTRLTFRVPLAVSPAVGETITIQIQSDAVIGLTP